MAAPSAAPEAEAPQSPELEAATRAVAELRDLEAIVEAAVEEAQQEAETAPPAPPQAAAPAPPQRTTPPEATAPPAPPPVVEPGLVCASCGATICFAADVLAERAVVLKEAVFCYDLDVCGREDACVYSATNPGANRFDVVRVDAQRLAPAGDTALAAVAVAGDLATAHSWFPPYGWRMASCGTCAAHLGWAFALSRDALGAVDGAAADGGVEFLGLIVTRLREKRVPRAPRGGGGAAARPAALLSLQRRRSRLLRLLRALGARLGALGAPPDDDDDEPDDDDAEPEPD